MRVLVALLVLLATIAAGPPPRALPVPPIPPEHPPVDQSAPIPDRDVQAPTPLDEQRVKVMVENFRVHRFNPSLGYTPGSHFETSEEKRPIQTPGLTVRLPLQ